MMESYLDDKGIKVTEDWDSIYFTRRQTQVRDGPQSVFWQVKERGWGSS